MQYTRESAIERLLKNYEPYYDIHRMINGDQSLITARCDFFEHSGQYITAVFICDTCDEDARKALKKCRIYKSFHFSLHGWMNFHAALVEVADGKVTSNASGHHVAKILKKILYDTRGKRS